MSKRKRAPKPGPDEPTDDASVKADMVHVTPDLLAGSPDIFADKKTEDAAAESGETADAVPEPIAEETPVEETPAEAEAAEAEATPTSDSAALAPEPPVTPPPPYVDAVPYPPQPRRGGARAARGA